MWQVEGKLGGSAEREQKVGAGGKLRGSRAWKNEAADRELQGTDGQGPKCRGMHASGAGAHMRLKSISTVIAPSLRPSDPSLLPSRHVPRKSSRQDR